MIQNKDELYKLGCDYMYKNQYKEAIDVFEDALKIDSRYSSALTKLAEAKSKLNR